MNYIKIYTNFMYLIFSNSLRMIKTNRNMLELWQIVCKKLLVKKFVGLIVLIVC
jgi:hypothetical protein